MKDYSIFSRNRTNEHRTKRDETAELQFKNERNDSYGNERVKRVISEEVFSKYERRYAVI